MWAEIEIEMFVFVYTYGYWIVCVCVFLFFFVAPNILCRDDNIFFFRSADFCAASVNEPLTFSLFFIRFLEICISFYYNFVHPSNAEENHNLISIFSLLNRYWLCECTHKWWKSCLKPTSFCRLLRRCRCSYWIWRCLINNQFESSKNFMTSLRCFSGRWILSFGKSFRLQRKIKEKNKEKNRSI